MATTKPKAYWHIHHDVLMEFATEPIKNRKEFIRDFKQQSEIKARLRLLKPVKGRLPAALTRAWSAYRKAKDNYDKVGWIDPNWVKIRNAYSRARTAYDKMMKDCMPKIEALHKKECPNCPFDGKTIFPKRKTKK